MTSTDDYLDEMAGRRAINDATAEDLLAGRAVPADLEPLATVVRALRDVSRQPVPPSAELAARMAAGTAVAAPAGSGRATGAGGLPWSARRIAAGAATTVRHRWSARVAAAGAAVAVLGVGSAGFAGSLPAPVQDRFETVVETLTPYHFPDRAGEPGDRPGPGAGRDHPAGGPGGADQSPGGGHPPGEGERPGNRPAPGLGEPDPGPGAGPPEPASTREPGPPQDPGPPEDAGPPDGSGEPVREWPGSAGHPPVEPEPGHPPDPGHPLDPPAQPER